MDMGSKDDTEQQKRNNDDTNFQSPNVTLDWQLSGSNFHSNPLVDSFCPTIWEQPTNSPNLSFYGNPSNRNPHEIAAMLKEGVFVPPNLGMFPQSFAQLPADSGFIERAARFSCFRGGSFSSMMSTFSVPESMKPCYRGGLAQTWRPGEVSASNGLNSPSAVNHKKMGNGVESSMDVALPNEHGTNEESPMKSEKKSDKFARSQDEGKESDGLCVNESDEAECSGRQEEMEGAAGSKKSERNGQDTELDQMKGVQQPPAEHTQDQMETQKGEQNLNSTVSKPGGKNGKQGSQASDPPKEEYIHVRARRGQATNSHSLAERIRREKISERMKFLQDLVPGCNKVTGKAVMLDEIINYVQSLQRQIEFLSMKLATVNPQLDCNIDALLEKDILQSRAGPSSSLAFPPDMIIPYTSLHALQSGLRHSGFPGMGYCTDAFRGPINPHFTSMSGGCKDPPSQVRNVWDDQLHNVVEMGYNSSAHLDSQDLSSLPLGQMKAEP